MIIRWWLKAWKCGLDKWYSITDRRHPLLKGNLNTLKFSTMIHNESIGLNLHPDLKPNSYMKSWEYFLLWFHVYLLHLINLFRWGTALWLLIASILSVLCVFASYWLLIAGYIFIVGEHVLLFIPINVIMNINYQAYTKFNVFTLLTRRYFLGSLAWCDSHQP